MSNSLEPGETPSYSASHPVPSCLPMTITVAISRKMAQIIFAMPGERFRVSTSLLLVLFQVESTAAAGDDNSHIQP